MALPGSVVEIIDAAPPASATTDTGTAFVIGMADRGPLTGQLTASDVFHSLSEWEAIHGSRQSYNSPEYDAIEAFFSEGGSSLYFARYAGATPVKASITLPASGSQGTFYAASEGAWANGGTITIASGVVTIAVGGVTEVSDTLSTVSDLVDFVADSEVVTYTPSVSVGTALSDSAARTLAGGTDDRATASTTHHEGALDRFGSDLGPGSVLAPGLTTGDAHTALATHARDNNRFAYCDAPDSATVATVAAAATAVRSLGSELARHTQVLDPWLTMIGTTAGTTRTVPPSGVQAGMAARTDAAGNPNRATAGRNGISRVALDVKYARSDTDRETLADAGVTVIRNMGGFVQTYDDVTPVNPTTDPEWLGAASNRMVMRIIADAYSIADGHMFGSVSGPADLAAFNGDLKGMLAGWFNLGALYSPDGSAAGAFRVETGSAVNTPTTLAARQLRAALALKLSPNARQVVVQITNTPLQSTL